MPSLQEWITNPLAIVEDIFAQSNAGPQWETKVLEYFKEKLKDDDAGNWVPSLNDVPLHYLKANSLVKFRCFVQDMFDPEFYMGTYEHVDAASKCKVMKFGKYKDFTECVEMDLGSTVMVERQTYAGCSHASVVPSTSYTPHRHKRSHEDDCDMDSQPCKQKDHATGSQGGTSFQSSGDSKQLGATSGQTLHCCSHMDLNFPLPGEKGPACHVKVYEGGEMFKVNDMLEVYGILSVDTQWSGMAEEKDAALIIDHMDCADSVEERRVHSPPASLVPRLHMLLAHRLQHNNPLLPPAASNDRCSFTAGFLGELAAVRAELLEYLTHVLLGDELAAEYTILHLISSVYARRDVLPLGKFTLNLSGCPQIPNFTELLYRTLQQLVANSFRLSMSLDNMNSLRFVPRKDYTANRLVSGILQLGQNTSLFLDETLLEQGQLGPEGVQNITALGNLISWQKIDYDFSFHQMEYPCNVNVLITSEGRSILPSDCQVHLQPKVAPPSLEEYLAALHAAVGPSTLNRFRIYVSLLRTLEYGISEDITKAVEEDFVEMRKDDPQNMTSDDLHRMLVIARLLSLSMGQTALSWDQWMKAKHLEMLRMNRVEQQKCVTGNEP
ncbi:hypothetical protein AAFF_G00139320 [Aldrovandia affinis]|uniref:Mini-chromosome maintenance complex-binding protein n=1 Tax=Aldrovandia affinis TaxID=143900 RepID=A0AAD7TCG9_9TELE|nr:hypothetical protein AAFF_G00139320 [Aldrovandia affinis]